MKTLQSISQTLKKWQRTYSRDSASNVVKKAPSTVAKTALPQPRWFRWMCKIHPPIMLALSLTTITGVVSYRFYNQPELAVGTISPTKIIAPQDGSFIDQKTTEELKRNTRSGLLPSLKRDDIITANVEQNIDKFLTQVEESRAILKGNPVIDNGVLSTPVQQYLMKVTGAEWQKIIDNRDTLTLINEGEDTFALAVNQLINYQNRASNSQFEDVINRIATQRSNYQIALAKLPAVDMANATDKEILLDIDESLWLEVKSQVKNVSQKILTQGLPFGLPDNLRKRTVELHFNDAPIALRPVLIQLVYSNLRTNLVIDETQTKERAEKAAQEIEAVIIAIEKNQTIIDIGQEISQADFVLLDNFGLSRRSINWGGVFTSGVLTAGALIIFQTVVRHPRQGRVRRRDQFLWWLLSISVPIISLFNVGYNSLPAVGFLMSTFYGPVAAVSHVSLTAGLTLFQTGAMGWQYLLSSYASSLLASIVASRLRSREELAFLGGGVGLTQGVVYFVATVASSVTVGTFWYAIIPPALWHGMVGLSYGVLALGISPYLERFFDLITPIRLAELCNPNRPLLKRLATEAPGTFQHTMFVASLAEAAAQKINCNVELVRAGTLYHDIGKMHDPLGFIENQMGGKNKHDEINDPWISADIIKKHVSQGIVMAKKCGLPQAIQNFIPEHQGTLLISYFYFQAHKQQEENPDIEVKESDFRYDGPIPQSRETGVVMLADGCEAALRSLKGATPDQAIAMVNKIFKARWRDHQLDECGLRYEELPAIAEVFVTVWQQSNHERISYPKGALEMKPSAPVTN